MNGNNPEKVGISTIIGEAFSYWTRTLMYQVMFSLLYISILITVLFYFAEYYGIMEDYLASVDELKNGMEAYAEAQKKIIANPDYGNFSWVLIGVLTFLFPLNMGLYKMFRKLDLKEPLVVQDLFAGYVGINFFNYASYYFFWFMVFSLTAPTVFLGIIWVGITLFSAPLMFFRNLRIFQTFSLNITAWKKFFPLILSGILFSIIFKFVGMITIIGIPFTFAFTNAMIYVLYKGIFREEERPAKQ